MPKPGEDENGCSFAAGVDAGLNAGGGSLGVATGSSIASTLYRKCRNVVGISSRRCVV